MSAAPYRVPVVFVANGVILRAPSAPFPPTEFVRSRVAGLLKVGSRRFVGEGVRSGVPASGTVRGRPFSERPTCDGVNCESSLPGSVGLSVPSICSESALKTPRVGLNTRVGRRSGAGELVKSPNTPVSFLPTGGKENRGTARREADGGGEGLEGDDGGLATRDWGEGGDITATGDVVRDRSLVACGKFA
jgi:hypothetical protein